MRGSAAAHENRGSTGAGHGRRVVGRGYAKAEEAEVSKLVSALDTAKNEKEVDAVIEEHAASVEAQVAATDAEVKSRGDQPFLGQQRKEQRITTDVKQEIQRAEKAVATECE